MLDRWNRRWSDRWNRLLVGLHIQWPYSGGGRFGYWPRDLWDRLVWWRDGGFNENGGT